MNKKRIALLCLSLCSLSTVFAGGILTNTNQSARFGRLMALEASTKADAAYYNPAGTIKLSDGFHFTFSNQSAFQERQITSSFLPMTGAGTKEYVGKASAPIIPSLQGVYRKGDWALSGSIAVVGGGGKATFDRGLPSFESQLSVIPTLVQSFSPLIGSLVPGGTLSCDQYSVDAYMTGTNYIFGAQLGGAYRINDMFSVYGGFRLNIVHNKYEGHVRNVQINPSSNVPGFGDGSMISAHDYFSGLSQHPSVPDANKKDLKDLADATQDRYLDSKQSGWGVAPIIGVHFSYEGLNIGAKYEFRAALNVENKTVIDNTGLFGDGVNTAHDVPALLAVGASYDFLPQLTASVSYHHFFDKDASMASDKQKHLSGNTNEYLAGIEYRINKMFLVSVGGQITDYGLGDKFQSDLSFSCDSYSLGFGGAVNVSKNVQINAAYFFTNYSDYTKESTPYNGNKLGLSGQDVFSRTNKVFTVGVDFSF